MSLKQKIQKELERASFTAYSDIRADKTQLHGNVNTVVNRKEAEAIFSNVLYEATKQIIAIQAQEIILRVGYEPTGLIKRSDVLAVLEGEKK